MRRKIGFVNAPSDHLVLNGRAMAPQDTIEVVSNTTLTMFGGQLFGGSEAGDKDDEFQAAEKPKRRSTKNELAVLNEVEQVDQGFF